MSGFNEKAPFEEVATFNPSAPSDEVIVQVVEKVVEKRVEVPVDRIKLVKEKPEKARTVYLPSPAPAPLPAPGMNPDDMEKIVSAIGKMKVTSPNVEVSVLPTPVSMVPPSVEVRPEIKVECPPTPRKWRVLVTERDNSAERRIKELTIEAVD